VTDAVECGVKIAGGIRATGGIKANRAFAKFAARQHLGLQFPVLAEKQALADSNLSPRPNQTLPVVRLGGNPPRKQNLNLAVQKITRRAISPAHGLCAHSGAPSIQPGWKHFGVVEHNQIARPQKLRQISKQLVAVLPASAPQVQHAGAISGRQRLLGNQLFG
jgi:hypothetical protein